MAKFDVTVQGVDYEVDAPDENTAWTWANQAHSSESTQKPSYSPEDIAKHMRKAAFSSYRAEHPFFAKAADIAGGVSSTMRGALNLLPGDIGEKVFPTEGLNKDSLAYTAGQIADPVALAIGGGAIKAAQAAPILAKAPSLAKTMIGGAAAGGGVAELQGGDPLTGAVLGGAAPAVIGGIGAAGKKAYNIIDQLRPGGAQRAAGRVASEVAGKKRDEIVEALTKAGRTETAKQVAAATESREFPALMKMAEENLPTESGIRYGEQAARRAGTLERVKPNLEAAEAARKAASDINYPDAFSKAVKVDPELAKLASDPFFKKAMKGVSDLAESKGITPKSNLTEYLHLVKTRMDEMLSDTSDTALGRSEKGAVQGVKSKLLDWMGKKNKAYEFARAEHERLSKPVSQAEVIGDIQDVLQGVAGKERITPFVGAVTKGQEKLVKGATGYGSGDLSTVLTPRQEKVVRAIQSQIEKGKTAEQAASEGMAKAKSIYAQEEVPITLPNLLSRPIALANAILKRSEGYGRQKTMDELSRLNLNPRELAEVMKNASESQKKWLASEIARKSAPYMIGTEQAMQQ